MEIFPEHTIFLDEGRFLPSSELQKENLSRHPFKKEILLYLEKSSVPIDAVLSWPSREGGTLSDLGILRHMIAGNITIDPFNSNHLNPNSYDVSLGKFYYSTSIDKSQSIVGEVTDWAVFRVATHATDVYNPQDPECIKKIWRGPLNALNVNETERKYGIRLKGIDRSEKVILLSPQQMILCHTEEFIGGRNIITTEISGKSTAGRNFLEICSDANTGSIGFINRWTLEIVNKSFSLAIPLIVGEQYAQIVFKRSQISAQSYRGNYQQGATIEEIKNAWIPSLMLPKVKIPK